MKLAIYGSRRQEPYIDQIAAFFDSLSRRGDEVTVHSKLYSYLLYMIPRSLGCVRRVTDSPDFTADYAVCIGGDGSFLRTAAWVADKEIPIIGVNTGHLGYLASLPVEEIVRLPEILAVGDLHIEDRSLIKVDCEAVDGWPYALNEVAVTKAEGASIIDVNAVIDGCPLADYRADGLLIATPTGSTAYNLSVGGPIVQPSAPVFVLSPIAAHSLSMRPLVIGDTSELEFTCDSRSHSYRIALDGRSYHVPLDCPVRLTRAPFVVKVIRCDGSNFAQTLRTKLSWG